MSPTTADGSLRFTGYADIHASWHANVGDWLAERVTSSDIARRQAALYTALQTGTDKRRRK